MNLLRRWWHNWREDRIARRMWRADARMDRRGE